MQQNATKNTTNFPGYGVSWKAMKFILNWVLCKQRKATLEILVKKNSQNVLTITNRHGESLFLCLIFLPTFFRIKKKR